MFDAEKSLETIAFFKAHYHLDTTYMEEMLSMSLGLRLSFIKIVAHVRSCMSKFLLRVVNALFIKNEKEIELRTFWFNGSFGVLQIEENQITTSFHFETINHKIASIFSLRNPDKLKHFKYPCQPYL